MKSHNQHLFSMVPKAEIQRSTFDRSHGYKTCFNAGVLVPFLCDEIVPGDTFKCNLSFLARLNTPIVPIMDNMYLDVFYFFVPSRLLWTHFVNFMGEREDPDIMPNYNIPLATADSNMTYETIADYMGLPVQSTGYKYSVLPMRAYWKIWDEWFRDENLQDRPPIDYSDNAKVWTSDSPINTDMTPYKLAPRGKRHDYFTSSLPFPQKAPAIEMPLGNLAPVVVDNIGLRGQSVGGGVINNPNLHFKLISNETDNVFAGQQVADVTSHMFADLSDATAVTINSLRQAFQLQRFYERDARGGTRYTELIRSHFNVISPDARLQRSEYLGGSSTRIHCTPIAQTASTDNVSPQGNLAAFGLGADSSHGFTKSFTEHGYVIGLMCVRADLTYQQGLNRMWTRQTREDFYWPTFAHLGEQAVLRKEIYCTGDSANDEQVFGYQERYAEYRYKPSQITGRMRSTYGQPLDYWHLAQKFDNAPVLDDTFIRENPPINRAVAVPSEPQFVLDAFIGLWCTRPMPVYGVPGLMDHF